MNIINLEGGGFQLNPLATALHAVVIVPLNLYKVAESLKTKPNWYVNRITEHKASDM